MFPNKILMKFRLEVRKLLEKLSFANIWNFYTVHETSDINGRIKVKFLPPVQITYKSVRFESFHFEPGFMIFDKGFVAADSFQSASKPFLC